MELKTKRTRTAAVPAAPVLRRLQREDGLSPGVRDQPEGHSEALSQNKEKKKREGGEGRRGEVGKEEGREGKGREGKESGESELRKLAADVASPPA